MPARITAADLGAWLLKANPKTWDVRRFLHDGNDRIGHWAVADNYRSRLMSPGQPVAFWISGSSGQLPRGIHGLGSVTGTVHEVPPEETDAEGPQYWLDSRARWSVLNGVAVDIPLLDEPVTADEIRAAGITDLEVQVMAQGSNPSWISRAQLSRLRPLLPDWPAVDSAGSSSSIGWSVRPPRSGGA